jgi:hypothetical protein
MHKSIISLAELSSIYNHSNMFKKAQIIEMLSITPKRENEEGTFG